MNSILLLTFFLPICHGDSLIVWSSCVSESCRYVLEASSPSTNDCTLLSTLKRSCVYEGTIDSPQQVIVFPGDHSGSSSTLDVHSVWGNSTQYSCNCTTIGTTPPPTQPPPSTSTHSTTTTFPAWMQVSFGFPSTIGHAGYDATTTETTVEEVESTTTHSTTESMTTTTSSSSTITFTEADTTTATTEERELPSTHFPIFPTLPIPPPISITPSIPNSQANNGKACVSGFSHVGAVEKPSSPLSQLPSNSLRNCMMLCESYFISQSPCVSIVFDSSSSLLDCSLLSNPLPISSPTPSSSSLQGYNKCHSV